MVSWTERLSIGRRLVVQPPRREQGTVSLLAARGFDGGKPRSRGCGIRMADMHWWNGFWGWAATTGVAGIAALAGLAQVVRRQREQPVPRWKLEQDWMSFRGVGAVDDDYGNDVGSRALHACERRGWSRLRPRPSGRSMRRDPPRQGAIQRTTAGTSRFRSRSRICGPVQRSAADRSRLRRLEAAP